MSMRGLLRGTDSRGTPTDHPSTGPTGRRRAGAYREGSDEPHRRQQVALHRRVERCEHSTAQRSRDCHVGARCDGAQALGRARPHGWCAWRVAWCRPRPCPPHGVACGVGTRERRQLLRARAVDERDGDDHDLREPPGATPPAQVGAQTHTPHPRAHKRARARTRARTRPHHEQRQRDAEHERKYRLRRRLRRRERLEKPGVHLRVSRGL